MQSGSSPNLSAEGHNREVMLAMSRHTSGQKGKKGQSPSKSLSVVNRCVYMHGDEG